MRRRKRQAASGIPEIASLALAMTTVEGHREEHGDVAIPWRTGFRSQRDCFGTLCLAMTALLFVESSSKHERRSCSRARRLYPFVLSSSKHERRSHAARNYE